MLFLALFRDICTDPQRLWIMSKSTTIRSWQQVNCPSAMATSTRNPPSNESLDSKWFEIARRIECRPCPSYRSRGAVHLEKTELADMCMLTRIHNLALHHAGPPTSWRCRSWPREPCEPCEPHHCISAMHTVSCEKQDTPEFPTALQSSPRFSPEDVIG